MAKIENMRVVVRVVTPVQELPGENKTPIVYMAAIIPPYEDRFTGRKGREQQWLFQVMGADKIKALGLENLAAGEIIDVTFYSESYCLESKEAGKNPFYVTNHTLASYKLVP